MDNTINRNTERIIIEKAGESYYLADQPLSWYGAKPIFKVELTHSRDSALLTDHFTKDDIIQVIHQDYADQVLYAR